MLNLEDGARALFLQNRREKDGYQFTVPSPGTYPYQWLWDSCFHTIVLTRLGDYEAARKEMLSLVSRQLPDGMLPHVIFWKQGVVRPYEWGWGRKEKDISAITQPPMLAYAIWELHLKDPNIEFLKKIYPNLLSFYKFLIEKRDPRDHHLVGIINPDESGEDNSPRFDKPMHLPHDVSFAKHYLDRLKLVAANRKCDFDAELCMSKTFWVKDVPFNAILIKNLQKLADIASAVGDSEGEHYATLHEGLIRQAIRTFLFKDGIFWSTTGKDYEPLRVATWAHFAPLFADLYSKEEAEMLITNHFRNERTFKATYGIRTVAKTEPSYTSRNFWRGPIWFAPHWFIYKGLKAYGYHDDAEFLKRANLTLLERHGFREYFHPDTGEAYGAKNFTWGALTLDMD